VNDSTSFTKDPLLAVGDHVHTSGGEHTLCLFWNGIIGIKWSGITRAHSEYITRLYPCT